MPKPDLKLPASEEEKRSSKTDVQPSLVTGLGSRIHQRFAKSERVELDIPARTERGRFATFPS